MDGLESKLQGLLARVSGSKKNPAAIVLPSGPFGELLPEHLAALARQEKRDFDVLVIGRRPAKVPKGLNALFYSERVPLGSSGSFSMGQILGYCLGYDFVINADLDCMPQGKDFVSRLARACRESGKAVLPISDEEGKKAVYCINRYGIVPRAALEKAGFEYAMFFKGAEDLDYQFRLEALGLLCTSEKIRTRHPYLSMALFEVAAGGSKYLYYYRAGLAILSLQLYRSLCSLRLGAALLFAARLVYNYLYYVPFSLAADRTLFSVALDGLSMGLEKRYDGLSFSIPQAETPKGAGLVLESGTGRKDGAYFFGEWKEGLGAAGRAARRLSCILKLAGLSFTGFTHFRPTEGFMEKYGFALPYLMFFRPVFYKGKCYGWGHHPLRLLAAFAATLAALPLFPLLVLFSLVRIRLQGDYPPTPRNAGRMVSNFSRLVLEK